GVTYSFSNGIGTLNLGGSSNSALIFGSKQFYISPDGRFIFGGSPAGFDMMVGVQVQSGAPSPALSGTFYQAGMDVDASSLSHGFDKTESYYGAFTTSGNSLVGHQRLWQIFNQAAFDYTFSDALSPAFDGSLADDLLNIHYIVGKNADLAIGFGVGPRPGVS